MLQHFTDRHNPINQNKLPCPRCNRSFNTKEGLEEHLLSQAHQLSKIEASAAAATAAADNDNLVTPAILLEDELQVACNDCGRLLQNTDSLHQHQWDSAGHTCVSKSAIPNPGSCVRACSQCGAKFGSADHLEEHFMDQHPISEVPECSEERTWQVVAERFISAWKKPCTVKVHRIFKVYNTGRRRNDFEEYRKELKKDMKNQRLTNELRKKVLRDGNELLLYHGATVKCRLGRGNAGEVGVHTASLCTSTDCCLCRILQAGFKKSKCKQDRSQRLGMGIHTYSVSSKASESVKCSSDVKEKYKVMLECKVLAGRPHHEQHTGNSEELEGPPMGFHSVQGDPNSDHELVVYDDRAILPAFIILYSSTDYMGRLYRSIRFLLSSSLSLFIFFHFCFFVLEALYPSHKETLKIIPKPFSPETLSKRN